MSETTKPGPAKDQIWSNDLRPERLCVVQWADAYVCRFVPDPNDSWGVTSVNVVSMLHAARWRCVGIETPHGRVMVGERRKTPASSPVRIGGILGRYGLIPDGVALVFDDGLKGASSARDVARWPLLPPAPPAEPGRCKCGNARPPSAVVCISCAGAALGEMPRPGGKSYAEPLMLTAFPANRLATAVAAYCGCAIADVEIEDDPQKATVTARVPTSVAPHTIRSAEMVIKRDMPFAVDFAIRYYKREALPFAVETIDVTIGFTSSHQRILDDAAHAMSMALLGPSAARLDTREQGPGIARLPKPTPAPEVVHCARWEDKWALP